jgi:hypothetical protein
LLLRTGRPLDRGHRAGRPGRGGTLPGHRFPVEHNFLGALPTVPDLFDRIDDAVTAHSVLLQVEYDARDGHPTRINVDVSFNIADEEYLLQSRNLMGLLTASGTTPPR